MKTKSYELSITTQGPTYPPSEVMDADGNFIVIGQINRTDLEGVTKASWGRAIVSAESPVPKFGQQAPYTILRELAESLPDTDRKIELYTLPIPLPCNNYNMLFAPKQYPGAHEAKIPSYPFHAVPIPDARLEDGLKITDPITLGKWCEAKGKLLVSVSADRRNATFEFVFSSMIPNSLYTVMSLRKQDLSPSNPTRPGPLGIPNVFITDSDGNGSYRAVLPNPFPSEEDPLSNRIINVVVLWMSYQMSHGGAIGMFGLGGDIHAQLKLKGASFSEFVTVS
ncbi:hypothetical protein [Alcaligenes sp.]|uniref:hypothetical protein n=1 Tax=Alcaligenes sp. TaxID=512 RepID=UPI003D04B263